MNVKELIANKMENTQVEINVFVYHKILKGRVALGTLSVRLFIITILSVGVIIMIMRIPIFRFLSFYIDNLHRFEN